MIGRLAASSFAILVCAWFALGTQQARNVSRASAIAESSGSLSAGQAARANSLLAGASTLNPDRQIDLLRGIVALDRSQDSRALQIFDRLTRQEPLNINAWVDLAEAGHDDRGLLERALVQIALLDPGPRKHH